MAEAKRTTAPAVPARAAIPTKPTVVCNGELMSREFSDGAYALRDAIVQVGKLMHEDDSYLNNEHRSSVHLAARITELIDRGGDFRAGAITAVANWLVSGLADASGPPVGWKPLAALPAYDGGDWDGPHPLATLWKVAGQPVSVMPDLGALRWGPPDEEARPVSVELVRAIGRPISRKRPAKSSFPVSRLQG